MYLLLAVILNSLEAVYEGLKYEGKHIISGSFEFILLCLTGFMCWAWITGAVPPPAEWTLAYPTSFWKILAAYIVFRFGYFDPILNLIRGKKITYLGDTKNIDLGIRWLLTKLKIGEDYFMFVRICCFISGGLVLLYGQTDKI